jgi:hypothetical protein
VVEVLDLADLSFELGVMDLDLVNLSLVVVDLDFTALSLELVVDFDSLSLPALVGFFDLVVALEFDLLDLEDLVVVVLLFLLPFEVTLLFLELVLGLVFFDLARVDLPVFALCCGGFFDLLTVFPVLYLVALLLALDDFDLDLEEPDLVVVALLLEPPLEVTAFEFVVFLEEDLVLAFDVVVLDLEDFAVRFLEVALEVFLLGVAAFKADLSADL